MQRRKIFDDDLVLKLHQQGKTLKEIAKVFGVSEVAIHKKLKRLGVGMPETFKNLTPKEQKFCLLVAQGKSRTQACLEAYDCKDRSSAKRLQQKLMKKDDINLTIQQLMEMSGMTRYYRITKLKQHVDHPDPVVSLKALDLSWKLDGSYAPEKNVNVNIDYAKLVELEQEIMQALAHYEEEHPEIKEIAHDDKD